MLFELTVSVDAEIVCDVVTWRSSVVDDTPIVPVGISGSSVLDDTPRVKVEVSVVLFGKLVLVYVNTK